MSPNSGHTRGEGGEGGGQDGKWSHFPPFFFLNPSLRLLLKVTEVTTEHQKQHKKLVFFYQWAKKASADCRSPPQELEVSPRSGLYLLVAL